jgi:hypothetical protein
MRLIDQQLQLAALSRAVLEMRQSSACDCRALRHAVDGLLVHLVVADSCVPERNDAVRWFCPEADRQPCHL